MVRSRPHIFRCPSPRETPCDSCGKSTFSRICDVDRRGNALDTVMCESCGLVSHERIDSPEQLHAYYGDRYRKSYHGRTSPKSHRVLRAWQAGQIYSRLLTPHLPTGGRVLEVGAGLGANVKALELAGFETHGIDPGVDFVQYGRDRLKANLDVGCWEDLTSYTNSRGWDAILLIHVIEHLPSPRGALTALRQMLAPSGRLYVECPDIAAPHAAPSKWFHRAHIYNFHRQTLVPLAMSVGFQVIAEFHHAGNGCVSLLLERTEQPLEFPTGISSGDTTFRLLNRFTTWGYYARVDYLAKRLRRDCNFVGHRLLANWRCRRLEDRLTEPNRVNFARAA